MAEVDQIERALETVQWPKFVADRRVVLDLDATGEDAVWIWLVVPDEHLESWSNESSRIRSEIRAALKANRIDRWPYLRLLSDTEAA